jgi:hypothetical protein
MKKATIASGAFATLIALLVWDLGHRVLERNLGPDGATTGPTAAATIALAGATHEGLIVGRVTTDDGSVYEGRLRWGGDEEALWGNYFNGFKAENPWVADVPRGQLSKGHDSFEVFGIEVARWERRRNLGRPFMARFGDIARIDPHGKDLQVTLKSGTVFHLDRYAADDLADGVRVWDARRGVVDIGEWKIRSIEFLGTTGSAAAPRPLYGTVRTRHGEFTGFVQWNREECVGTDLLDGRTADGDVALPFDGIRSIARSGEGSLVTLLDGREVELSGTREVGTGNGGMYVDDTRYGRVLVSWGAFERVDFSPGGAGPAYRDFPAGRSLTGTVITRSGRRLTGRLIYDLDESETTETLDAPSRGVDYTIPFGIIAAMIVNSGDSDSQATVMLRSGEELRLDRAGDLGEENAGLLVFFAGSQRSEYVPWSDVGRIDFDGANQR